MFKGKRDHSQKIILLLGDLILLYISLFITLAVRYASITASFKLWEMHFLPFSIINILWILIFYIAGLYDIGKKIFTGLVGICKTMIVGGMIAVLFFYLFPYFGIAPKMNLLIDTFIASFLIWGWRKIFFQKLIRGAKTKVFLLDDIEEMADFAEFLNKRPHLGYETANEISNANIIVVSEQAKQKPGIIKSLYEKIRFGENITIIDFDKFYEALTGKIPIYLVGEAWFLENLMEINKQAFERVKRWLDIIIAVIFLILLIIITPIIALLIKLDSRGPVFYKQKRVGKNGKIFEVIKFRSMYALTADGSAEKDGVKTGWTKPDKKDKRVTFLGNILRKTRIDELPQVWNVLEGNLSFVGPRPERPEFVKELIEKIPHYSMRHLIKPGLTGWGQINFSEAAAEDAPEKLQYDLYYIKNRSMALEIAILLKTIMIVLRREGK